MSVPENMKLPLRSDLNGNAFPVSSSSSSSSSSSPESIRGLSGADGRPDYDLLEVTLTTVVGDAVVVSKWLPEDDVSEGKTESNDNSVSVYLDADEFHRDAWNDNLTLSLTTGSHGNDDSSTPDSDATEVPADDDDDDEETLFLSVCSSVSEQNPVPPEESHSPPSEDLIESTQITLPAAPTKPAKTKTTGVSPASTQRTSKLDLKTVRTRIGSRSNQSPPKPPSQVPRTSNTRTSRTS